MLVLAPISITVRPISPTPDPPFTESNFSQVVWELKHRGYPTSWWVSPVRKAYLWSNAITPWAKLKENPRWMPPVPAKQCILCPQYTFCPIPLPSDCDTQETICRLATAGIPMIPLQKAVTLPVHHVPPEMQHHTHTNSKPAPTTRQRAWPARRRTRRLTVRKRPDKQKRQPAPLPPEPKGKRLTRRLGIPPLPLDKQQAKVPTRRRGRPPRAAAAMQPHAPPQPQIHPPPPATDAIPLPADDLPDTLTDTQSVCPSVHSSTSSLPPSALAPIGTTASLEHTALVQCWWQQEIEPYKRLILGHHDARHLDSLPTDDLWLYQKYRYDVHYHYQHTTPPTQAMWQQGILTMDCPEAIAWLNLQAMTAPDSDSSDG